MARLARALIVMTLPAAAVGVLAGLALRVVAPPEAPRDTPPSEVPREVPRDANGEAGDTGDEDRPRRPRARTPRARVRPTVTDDGGAPLDPSFAERLSHADERIRYAAALELLRMGPGRAGAVDHLEPPTPEGRDLRDRIVNALSKLGLMEKHENWMQRSEESKRKSRLDEYARVIPAEHLRDERRVYWELRVARDPDRLARGLISEGEAAWNRLELAVVRRETGEIGEAELRKEREQSLPAAREWFAAQRGRADVSPARMRELEESFARLEK